MQEADETRPFRSWLLLNRREPGSVRKAPGEKLLHCQHGCLVSGGVVRDLRPQLDAWIPEREGLASLCIHYLTVVGLLNQAIARGLALRKFHWCSDREVVVGVVSVGILGQRDIGA